MRLMKHCDTYSCHVLQSRLENCTLSYFPMPGRGEHIRLALEIAGVKFNEDNFGFAEFRKKQAAGDFVFGTVPELTLADGRWYAFCI